MFAFNGAVEQGLLFAIMALGLYLTFRILNFADMTVDGSFALGGALAAKLIIVGVAPIWATLLAMVAGSIAGLVTGVLTTKGKINGLLAGILTMIALYSINLRIMGQANLPLLRTDTLYTFIKGLEFPGLSVAGFTVFSGEGLIFLLLVAVIVALIVWFLHTDFGLDLRATGDNPTMIRSFGADTDATTLWGLALSNSLVACAGALVAQYQGFADVNMGIGMIVIGLASVIVGEVLFGSRTILRAAIAVALGSVVYRLVIMLALDAGLEASDMKLITAVIVVAALTFPNVVKGAWKKGTQSVKGGAPRA